MNHGFMRRVVLAVIILCAMALCVPLCVYCIELVKEVPTSIASWGDMPAGNRSKRLLVVANDLIPGKSTPMVVVAGDREVAYFDGATLEPIGRRSYSSDEKVLISENGRYVAVRSQTERRSEKTIYGTLRIEDWQGRTLWRMDASLWDCIYEPAPRGGFIEYPSPTPAMYEWPGSAGFKLVPEFRRHGLCIYDATGKLLLESVEPSEIGFARFGWVSHDGRYLAFAYNWFSPEKRGKGSLAGDKSCLVVYDLMEGKELWRHYFDSGGVTDALVLSGEAGRVLCVAPPAGTADLMGSRRSLYLFDLNGKEIMEKAIVPGGSRFTLGRQLVLSDDGKLCALVVDHSRISLVRMEHGGAAWEFEGPETTGTIECIGVANDGSVLLVSHARERVANARGLMMVNGAGQLADTLEPDQLKWPGHTPECAMSRDGKSLWVLNGSTLGLYSLDGITSQKGGQLR